MLDSFIAYICAPILVLAIVIFVHELGHYLMARVFRVPAPVFSVGFGREVFGFMDRRGTRWKFSIFPFGGYVKIDESYDRPLYQRVWIVLGGPLSNFIFSFVLMVAVFMLMGAPAVTPVAAGVNIKGGAYAAGVRPGDRIISLEGHFIPKDMDDIKSFVTSSPKEVLRAVLQRDGQEMVVDIPILQLKETNDFGDDKPHRKLGILFAGQSMKLKAINRVADVDTEGNVDRAREEILRHIGKDVVINFGLSGVKDDLLIRIDADLNKGLYDPESSKFTTLVLWDDRDTEFYRLPFSKAVIHSGDLLYKAIKKTFGVLYQMVVGKKDTGDLGGVVAISSMTGEVTENASVVGPFFIFKFLAILSASIGFLNLLPFPMLDGGHLLFHGIEKITGVPPSLKIKGYFYGFGVVFIVLIVIMVNYHDIVEKFSF